MTSLADHRRRPWALVILGELGPAAAAALPAIEHLDGAATTIWRIDPDRGRALELHRRADTRDAIMGVVAEQGFPAVAVHLARLLEDHDPDVVTYALGGADSTAYSYRSPDLVELAERHPALVPIDLVRVHARRGHPAASHILERLSSGDDAALAIDALARGARQTCLNDLYWLGPLEASERLIATCGRALPELVERRRAAGLATPPAAIHAFIAARLEASLRPSRNSDFDFRAAIDAALQLPDATSCELLLPTLTRYTSYPTAQWSTLVDTFGLLGEARDAVLAKAAPSKHLGWLRSALSPWRPWGMSADHGDELLRAGKIEDMLGGAYQHYARALLRGPSAYCALQLAWIDRAFGTPIEPRRIDWLGALGVRDGALLDQLALPIVPMPGGRGSHRLGQTFEADQLRFAQAAEDAGLPSIAMLYWTHAKRPDDAARARASTLALIARLRSACED